MTLPIQKTDNPSPAENLSVPDATLANQPVTDSLLNVLDFYTADHTPTPHSQDLALIDLSHGLPPVTTTAFITPQTYTGYTNVDGQWHLHNDFGIDINVQQTWADYTGKGITVGVVDEGVQFTHPELSKNYNASIDYNAYTKLGNGANTSSAHPHGTSVAGVIVAANNGIGTTGIAYDAKVASYVLVGGSITNTMFADVMNRQAAVDISNNSWGFPIAFSATGIFQAGVETAMQNVESTGRAGLGTVFVIAAGNSRASGDNTNYSEFLNTRFSIDVAAAQENGTISSFSTPGSSILLTAPGVNIQTTDLIGTPGFSTSNYATLNGTSFAAPVVSGVVALMLQANRGLGYRDVQEILAATSRQVDSSNPGWQSNGSTHWNGGGMHFSEDYGAGFIDATAAVRLAESWDIVKTADVLSNEVSVTNNSGTVSLAVNDFATTTSTINVASGIDIQHAEVQLNMSHSKVGDLVITLTSPDGTESILVNRPTNGSAADSYNSLWSFSTTHDWGETGVGTWTLSVTDQATGNTGTLSSWSLKLYGNATTTNDTYLYTDEFSNYTNTGQHTLTDTGGNDTINAAAVSTAVTIDLAPGSVNTIDGSSLTIAAGTTIENAFGGGGNDTLTGNSSNNILGGGHGDDALYGLSGNDTLIGGFGNDTLDGGTGNDLLKGGAGNDIYELDSASDTVTENLNEGTDTIHAAFTYTLGTNIENLEILGTGNDNGTGNILNNILTGNSGNNILDGSSGNDTLIGGLGADTLIGGLGNDTFILDSPSDTITENIGSGTDTVEAGFSYTLLDNLENLTLLGSGSYSGTGNILNNLITGNDGNNILDGGAGGNDTLIGGPGNDTMAGGIGNDTYGVDSASDVINESLNGGTDTVLSSVSYTLGNNLENLTLNGTANINATGNSLNNVLTGNTGNNTLDGGAGINKLVGGSGDDLYLVNNTGNTVVELANGGTDSVHSAVTFSLSANIENLELEGSGTINGNGNTLSNVITGNAGNNILNASTGNDTLIGGLGDDTLLGGGGNDTYHDFTGSFGHDVINDLSGADVLDLSGYTLSQATFTALDGTDLGVNIDELKISFAGGDSILIEKYFNNVSTDFHFSGAGAGHMENIIFGDDSLVDLAQVKLLIA